MSSYIHSSRYDLRYSINGAQSYVILGRELSDVISKEISSLSPHVVCVISDQNVAQLHQEWLRDLLGSVRNKPRQYWHILPPGEHSKTLSVAEKVLEDILPHMTRDGLIIALGGGVVGNLSGTVASLLFRGTRFLHIPTSFMAQADSAIGIKQAVNARIAKNAFGAYHTPIGVFNDLRLLDTLPAIEFRNGLAESIKVAVARKPDFAIALRSLLERFGRFSDDDIYFLLEETIYPKLAGLSTDPYEKNSLVYLEIGHTVGHAIERASGGRIPHGEAIAMGMLIETRCAIELHISNEFVFETLADLFRLLSFPEHVPDDVSSADIIRSIRCDNRRVEAGPVFVLATDIGKTRSVTGIDLQLVQNIIETFRIDGNYSARAKVSHSHRSL